MADSKSRNEPQSYGSQAEWVKGNVGETVNRQKGTAGSPQSDFYESRHDSDESPGAQGGKVSPVQTSENVESAQPGKGATESDEQPVPGVTTSASGARRGSFFKDRDY